MRNVTSFFQTLFPALIILMLGLIIIPASAQVKVGLLLDDYMSERWYLDEKFLKEAVERNGGQVFLGIAYGDPKEQVFQARQLISDGVQVLVVVASNSDAAAMIVDLAHEKGVPVVAYDRMINNSDVDFYLSYDNEMVGSLMAEYAVLKKPKGNYVIISGPSSDKNTTFVREGERKVLQKHVTKGDIRIIEEKTLDAWNELEAMIFMDEFLVMNKNVHIDAILAPNDAIAGGIISALENHEREGVLVTGQDAEYEACKNIIQNRQAMTVYKAIKPLAYKAAEVVLKLVSEENIDDKVITMNNGVKDVPTILLEPIAVDKKNMNETVFKDQHIKFLENIKD